MSFLPDPTAPLTADEQAVWDAAHTKYPNQNLTNMKRTLLHDPESFNMYIEWYGQFDRLAAVIGERAVHLFCYAISSTNDCLICSVYFRRVLIEGGADPEHPEPTAEEQVLMEFGQALAKANNDIPDELYAKIEEFLPKPEDRVLLVAFAAQMAAANIFNNAGRIPLDAALYEYRAQGDDRV